jgi:hypothetical protein
VVQSGEVILSTAKWIKGVDTYLPETDRVVLTIESSEGGKPRAYDVAFDAISSRLTEVPGLRPVRYRTGDFPTNAELAPLVLNWSKKSDGVQN